jgi:hypothetical protein
MEIRKEIEYFDKAKKDEMWRQITIIFDEDNRITYRQMYDQVGFFPIRMIANKNDFSIDDRDKCYKKHGRGRIRTIDLNKLEEMETLAKEIIRDIEF